MQLMDILCFALWPKQACRTDGGNLKFVAINRIAAAIGTCKSATFRMFHAIENMSSFAGGKKTVWLTWNFHPKVTETFES